MVSVGRVDTEPVLERTEAVSVMLLAEVSAVIAPQHDDCVLRMFALIESANQSSDLFVGKANTRQVSLHRVSPVV